MDVFSVTQFVWNGRLVKDGDHGIDEYKKILIKRIKGEFMSDEQREIALADVETNYIILCHYIDRIQDAVGQDATKTREKIKYLIEKRSKKSCIIIIL